jgi:hypothetical protein
MKRSIVFLSIAVALIVIGIHQSFFVGITNSYWIFMFSGTFLLLSHYFRKHIEEPREAEKEQEAKKKQRQASKGRKRKKRNK